MSRGGSAPGPDGSRRAQEVVRTAPRPPIRDLDGLPFVDRGLIDLDRYRGILSMAPVTHAITFFATRGCPYRCAYCHRLWPKKVQLRSAESLFEELRAYYDLGFRRFSFLDDIFNIEPGRGARFFELIIQHGLQAQLFFPNGLRGDLLTPAWIDLMAEAGVARLALALETASPRLQRLIGKGLNVDRLRDNIDYLTTRHPQVVLDLFMMAGFPTETLDEVKETLRFARNVHWLSRPILHLLIVFPGTAMEELALAHGISPAAIQESLAGDYFSFPTTLPFSALEVQRLRAEFFRSYYMHPDRVRHVLRQQLRLFTEAEILEAHRQTYFRHVTTFDELLERLDVARAELGVSGRDPADFAFTPEMVAAARQRFPAPPTAGGLRLLLLDVSTAFRGQEEMAEIGVEQPLGLLSLLTTLHRELPGQVDGSIAKARVDFDSFADLERLVAEQRPEVVGVRALSLNRELLEETLDRVKALCPEALVVAGGPYATSSIDEVALHPHVDVVVVGEGEVTFTELVRSILDHGRALPPPEVLAQIPGLAFAVDAAVAPAVARPPGE